MPHMFNSFCQEFIPFFVYSYLSAIYSVICLFIFIPIFNVFIYVFIVYVSIYLIIPWWRHQMETFSALLAICAGNSPVPGEFPTQRPVTRGFDIFFDLRLNIRLGKQSLGWWFETPSRSLWRHNNALTSETTVDGNISVTSSCHRHYCCYYYHSRYHHHHHCHWHHFAFLLSYFYQNGRFEKTVWFFTSMYLLIHPMFQSHTFLDGNNWFG